MLMNIYNVYIECTIMMYDSIRECLDYLEKDYIITLSN